MRRLRTTIVSTILAGWFTIGDYISAEEAPKPGNTTATQPEIDEKIREEARTLLFMGQALVKESKYEEAEKVFKRAIKTDPKYDAPYHNLALVYKDLKRWDDAVSFFKMSLELYPDSSASNVECGVTLSHQMKFKEALPYLQKAVQLDPDDKRAKLWLSYAQKKVAN